MNCVRRESSFIYTRMLFTWMGDTGAEVREMTIKTLSGSEFSISLSMSLRPAAWKRSIPSFGPIDGGGSGNINDVVGRYFMTHLVYVAGSIVPTDPYINLDLKQTIHGCRANIA